MQSAGFAEASRAVGYRPLFAEDDGGRALVLVRKVPIPLLAGWTARAKVHAHATNASVAVGTEDGELHITVADDGRGFDPASPTGGFGLVGMRERIDLAGGRLTIERADPGTRVTVALPVQARP